MFNHLIREFVKVAVGRPSLSERTSHIRQLLLAVAQVADVDDGHLVEGQHGSLFDPAQDHRVQLCVVVEQRAVHLQTQQVRGEVDMLDGRGKLPSLRCQYFGRLPWPQHLPPVQRKWGPFKKFLCPPVKSHRLQYTSAVLYPANINYITKHNSPTCVFAVTIDSDDGLTWHQQGDSGRKGCESRPESGQWLQGNTSLAHPLP